jgi:hypothetical protein
MAKQAMSPRTRAKQQDMLESMKRFPHRVLREIETLRKRLEKATWRLDKVELQVIIPLPGNRLKRGSKEQHEMRMQFVEALWYSHIPADWQECDYVAIRKQDLEQAQQHALTLDNRYHEYMNN